MKRKWLLFLLVTALLLPFYALNLKAPFSHALENDNLQDFLNFENVVAKLNNNSTSHTVTPLSTTIDDIDHNGEYDFTPTSQEESYTVATNCGTKTYSNYALKRVIVSGNLKGRYLANTSASYDNLHILSFDSEEQTKKAYEDLFLPSDKNFAERVSALAENPAYKDNPLVQDVIRFVQNPSKYNILQPKMGA